MKKEVIQAKIQKKTTELEFLKEELKKIEAKELTNNSEWLDVSDIKGLEDYEVELYVHDKGKSYDDLGLKDREDELLTAEQCILLANSKYATQLKMDGSSTQDDFFIKQPFNKNREKGYVAGFYSYGGRSCFYSGGNSGYADYYRGVRFCRKKIKGNKKQ